MSRSTSHVDLALNDPDAASILVLDKWSVQTDKGDALRNLILIWKLFFFYLERPAVTGRPVQELRKSSKEALIVKTACVFKKQSNFGESQNFRF